MCVFMFMCSPLAQFLSIVLVCIVYAPYGYCKICILFNGPVSRAVWSDLK